MQEPHYYSLDGFQFSFIYNNHSVDIQAFNQLTKARYSKSIDDITAALLTDNIALNSEGLYRIFMDAFNKKEICNQISISQNGKVKMFLKQHGKGQLVACIDMDKISPSMSNIDSDDLYINENSNVQNKLSMIQNELYHIKHDLKQNLDDKFDILDQRLRLLESKVINLPPPNYNSIGSFSQVSTDVYSPLLHIRKKKFSENKIEEISKSHESEVQDFNPLGINSKFYHFSNGNKMISRISHDKHWESVYCSIFFKEKYEILNFKLVKSLSNYIMIGLAPDNYIHQKACFDKPGSLFFYCYNGTIYLDGVVFSTKSLGLNDGDILTMMVDFEDTVVSFLINDKIIYSDVFPGLSKSNTKYFPCVETFNIDDTVSLVSHPCHYAM